MRFVALRSMGDPNSMIGSPNRGGEENVTDTIE